MGSGLGLLDFTKLGRPDNAVPRYGSVVSLD